MAQVGDGGVGEVPAVDGAALGVAPASQLLNIVVDAAAAAVAAPEVGRAADVLVAPPRFDVEAVLVCPLVGGWEILPEIDEEVEGAALGVAAASQLLNIVVDAAAAAVAAPEVGRAADVLAAPPRFDVEAVLVCPLVDGWEILPEIDEEVEGAALGVAPASQLLNIVVDAAAAAVAAPDVGRAADVLAAPPRFDVEAGLVCPLVGGLEILPEINEEEP